MAHLYARMQKKGYRFLKFDVLAPHALYIDGGLGRSGHSLREPPHRLSDSPEKRPSGYGIAYSGPLLPIA
jgi:hypothetical protein